jgi:hypothetical protein
MFHGVEMDVIDMIPEVIFIANHMHPKSPLPDGGFSSFQARSVPLRSRTDPIIIPSGKEALNLTPAEGIIGLSLGK